jgi:hypothetical protein
LPVAACNDEQDDRLASLCGFLFVSRYDREMLVNEPPLLPTKFWAAAEQLVATSEIVIDRPKGSRHPRLPEAIYPVAYGYLTGTTASDGEGIDIWVGSLEP